MARPRDNQKSKLYKADDVIHGQDLPTVADMQDYVDDMTRRAWWKRRYPGVASIEVRDGRGRRSANGSYDGWRRAGRVKMPRWSRYEAVLLHEVAHCATTSKYGRSVASHGPEYAKIFIELVQWRMGKEEADKLRASFKKHRVKYRVAKPKPVKWGKRRLEPA